MEWGRHFRPLAGRRDHDFRQGFRVWTEAR